MKYKTKSDIHFQQENAPHKYTVHSLCNVVAKRTKTNTSPQHCHRTGNHRLATRKHNLEQSQYQNIISILPGKTRPTFITFLLCCHKPFDFSSSKLLDCRVLLCWFVYHSSLHYQARWPSFLSCRLLSTAMCSESTSCLVRIARMAGGLLSVFGHVSLYYKLPVFDFCRKFHLGFQE